MDIAAMLIFTIWALFATLLIIAMYGYKFKVLRTLGEHGHDDIEKYLPSNQLRQIQEYKKVCIENNLSLGWYRYMATFPFFAAFVILAWIGLMIFTN